MKVSCPKCGQEYEIDNSRAGQTVQCAMCCEDFTLPTGNKQVKITPGFAPHIDLDECKSLQKSKHPTHKKCPMCGETILYVAKKCRYCQTELQGTQVKERINYTVYVLLGLFFGNIGFHNIYAKQWVQFALHILFSIFAAVSLTFALEFFLVLQGFNSIFAIVEICIDPNKSKEKEIKKPSNPKFILFLNILCVVSGLIILFFLGHIIMFLKKFM